MSEDEHIVVEGIAGWNFTRAVSVIVRMEEQETELKTSRYLPPGRPTVLKSRDIARILPRNGGDQKLEADQNTPGQLLRQLFVRVHRDWRFLMVRTCSVRIVSVTVNQMKPADIIEDHIYGLLLIL